MVKFLFAEGGRKVSRGSGPGFSAGAAKKSRLAAKKTL
jgi:hypothetical protein